MFFCLVSVPLSMWTSVRPWTPLPPPKHNFWAAPWGEGGVKHRSPQAWITVCSNNTSHLFQRQKSKQNKIPIFSTQIFLTLLHFFLGISEYFMAFWALFRFWPKIVLQFHVAGFTLHQAVGEARRHYVTKHSSFQFIFFLKIRRFSANRATTQHKMWALQPNCHKVQTQSWRTKFCAFFPGSEWKQISGKTVGSCDSHTVFNIFQPML